MLDLRDPAGGQLAVPMAREEYHRLLDADELPRRTEVAPNDVARRRSTSA